VLADGGADGIHDEGHACLRAVSSTLRPSGQERVTVPADSIPPHVRVVVTLAAERTQRAGAA
jgi:hypothetical protein